MQTYKVTVNDNGTIRWYNENNQLHRLDGPAVENSGGDKSYWINGKLHREDGPAIESANGYKSYWINGKLHREDGPAIESANGYKAYYINDERLTKKEFNTRTKKELTVKQIEDLLGYSIKVVKE